MTKMRSGWRRASVKKPSRTVRRKSKPCDSIRSSVRPMRAAAASAGISSTNVWSGSMSPTATQPDTPDGLDIQSAGMTLIDDVGEQEAIGNDDFTGVKRGADHFFDQLGPSGHVEEHFAAPIDSQVGSVQQDLAEFISQRRAPRIAAEDDVASLRPEPLDEQRNLRRFARSIHSVKRHKHEGRSRVGTPNQNGWRV